MGSLIQEKRKRIKKKESRVKKIEKNIGTVGKSFFFTLSSILSKK